MEGVLCFTDVVLETKCASDDINDVRGGEGGGAQGGEGGVGVYVGDVFPVYEVVAVFELWCRTVAGVFGGGE